MKLQYQRPLRRTGHANSEILNIAKTPIGRMPYYAEVPLGEIGILHQNLVFGSISISLLIRPITNDYVAKLCGDYTPILS